MPTFQIRRNVPGAGQEDMDAGALRALMCAMEFPNLKWVESHWDRAGGVQFCIFEAERAEHLFDHARRARIPCDEVREVMVRRPEQFLALMQSQSKPASDGEEPDLAVE